MSAFESDFRAALSAAGIDLPPGEPVIVDDQVHRYKGPNDKEKCAWYALHANPAANGGEPIITGAYGSWKGIAPVAWCSRQRNSLSREELQAVTQAGRDLAVRRAEDEKRLKSEAAERCRSWFAKFPRAEGHMYLVVKGVEAIGPIYEFADELFQGWLALPLQDSTGAIRSAQFIADDGTKRFCYGGEVKGCFFPMLEVPGGPIIICEGYATGASIAMATRWTVICAMNCGNLLPVAQSFREQYPDRPIVIAADNDAYTEGNPGVTKAREVVKKVKNCLLAIPEFADTAEGKPTDFNDLHQLAGLPEVMRQVYAALPTFKLLQEREFNPNSRPPEIRRVYSINETVISTPANITSITSSLKSGKSAVIGAMCAAPMTNGDGADNLGFESENPKNLAVLHFDSEQSPDDHWWQVDRIMRRATRAKPPEWFHSYCLTGLGHTLSWKCVKDAMMVAAERHGGIHSVHIDGVADMVADVNDPEESNDFVAELHDLSIRYDSTTIGVIHFNPGSEKSRGHLGSQLERKAETNLTLEKNADQITRIYSVKNRRAGIPKFGGPCFYFDKEKSLHLSCDPDSWDDTPQTKRGRPAKYSVDQLVKALIWKNIPSVSWTEFFNIAKDIGMPKTQFSTLLNKALQDQLIFQSPVNGRYQVVIKSTESQNDT